MTYQPRKNPCISCPYRQDVESGIWDAEEYDKLPKYDGEIIEQVMSDAGSLFMCHQTGEEICSGWLGHREEPVDLFAVRIGISKGKLDPSVNDYTTSVPLFSSGSRAAEHGKRDILSPSERASDLIDKIVKKRGL
jgi:hypothetical protein